MSWTPRISVKLENNATWTAVLFINDKYYARMKGFATADEARAAITKRYL